MSSTGIGKHVPIVKTASKTSRKGLVRPLSVVGVAIILFLALPATAQQSDLSNLFGPEVFVRSFGAPNPVTREFSLIGFEAPFVLHLRNGDEAGSKRVSSARVVLNGKLLFSPSAFSQQAAGYDIPVSVWLSEPSTLEVVLEGAPGSQLTIWIEGERKSIQSAGPEGAHLQYPNGVILDIPPGALDDVIDLEVKELPADEANALLFARSSNDGYQKRYLGGFEVVQHVQFNTPIKATFPVLPLEHNEIPIPMEFDLALETYWATNEKLAYHADQGLAEIELLHFSSKAAIGASQTIPKSCLVDDSSENCQFWERWVGCQDCSMNTDPSCQEFATPLDPVCCLIPQNLRPRCASAEGCNCCTEKDKYIENDASDVDIDRAKPGSGCRIVTNQYGIIFWDCPNTPTAGECVPEISADCPKGMELETAIDLASLNLYECEVAQPLEVTLTGRSSQGVLSFPPEIVEWSSERPDVAAVVAADGSPQTVYGSPVNVRGLTAGTTKVWAKIHCMDVASSIAIQVRERQITVTPPSVNLLKGDKITPTISVEEVCGTGTDCQMEWSSDNDGVASVDPATGEITGVSDGDAVIMAILDKGAYPDKLGAWCGRDFQATVNVHVQRTVANIEISPSTRLLRLGQRLQFATTLLDASGQPMASSSQVTWSSSNETIATVDQNGLVTGRGVGKADITATLEDEGVSGTASVTVGVSTTVTGTWSIPFPDTNYTAICSGTNGMAHATGNRTTTGVGVWFDLPSDFQPDGFGCIAIHDSDAEVMHMRHYRRNVGGPGGFIFEVVWDRPFPDDNYTAVCDILPFGWISPDSQSAGSMTVRLPMRGELGFISCLAKSNSSDEFPDIHTGRDTYMVEEGSFPAHFWVPWDTAFSMDYVAVCIDEPSDDAASDSMYLGTGSHSSGAVEVLEVNPWGWGKPVTFHCIGAPK